MFSSPGPLEKDDLINANVYGQSLVGSSMTGSQNAAMQKAAYNSIMQNGQITTNPYVGSVGRRKVDVGINIERAENGYILRSNGSSFIAATLEEMQQHVTSIVVSELVLDEGK